MAVRVVGGGAIVREAIRLLDGRPEASDGLPRFLVEADVPERAAAALREARAAGAVRVVILAPPDGPPVPELKAALRGDAPCTLLLPQFPYQDDLAVLASIVKRGIYPLPIGPHGMSRVDARDAADAAVRALVEPGHEGCVYPIVGPEALSQDEVAATWAHALGRPVRCADGPGALAARYRRFRDAGLRARCEDFARMDCVLRHPARPFGRFVRDVLDAARNEGADPSDRE